MKIILFGGAFDPPHLGHTQISNHLVENKLADEVWYLPTGVHDFLKNMTPAKHRIAMLKLLLEAEHQQSADSIKINLSEIKREGVSHSFDTLEQLSAQYPQHQFSFVIGADNLKDFHKWYKYQEMLKKYPFYVYPRKGFSMKTLHQGMIALEDVDKVTISSTDIRRKIKQNIEVNDLLSPLVLKYITQQQLYKN